MEAALSALCDRLWAELVAAPADRTSPYRLAALATVRERVPQVRTIVVRDVVASEREVVCFSDRRAPKIADIAHCAEVSLLVRDDTRSEQIRLNGVASVHPSGPRADAYWRDMHPGQTLNYLTTAAPGTAVQHPEQGYDPTVGEGDVELCTGRANFAVVVIRIRTLDWLHLDAKGHRRAVFDCVAGSGRLPSDACSGRWVVP